MKEGSGVTAGAGADGSAGSIRGLARGSGSTDPVGSGDRPKITHNPIINTTAPLAIAITGCHLNRMSLIDFPHIAHLPALDLTL